jgi:hypothetical protein
MGSVSTSLVAEAPCSVTVVRNRLALPGESDTRFTEAGA